MVDSKKKVVGVECYMIRDPSNRPVGVRANFLDNRMNFNEVILE